MLACVTLFMLQTQHIQVYMRHTYTVLHLSRELCSLQEREKSLLNHAQRILYVTQYYTWICLSSIHRYQVATYINDDTAAYLQAKDLYS